MDSCRWLQVWDSNPRLQGYEPCELAAVLTCQRAAELKGKMPGCAERDVCRTHRSRRRRTRQEQLKDDLLPAA